METIPPQYTETLDINNFMSIKKFYWEIKPFNIITGDMASGKSLCMKLLYFFENIFISSMLLSMNFSKKLFENGNFYDQLSNKFMDYFYLKDNTGQKFCITYNFKANGSNFNISVTGENSGEKKFVWKCDYLEEQLIKWSSYFKAETPDMAQEVRIRIHEEIKHDFIDKLPIETIFIPATRAALTVADIDHFKDLFLREFYLDKNYLLSKFGTSLSKELTDVLHVKNIKKNPGDENDVLFELTDKRIVPSLFSSSGQQELVYLLLFMEKLPEVKFNYGTMLSLFFEEPSAHLFPEEQKKLIECIIVFFRRKKELETRFFISTHSPYVLDSLNNILKKGAMIDKYKEQEDIINKEINIPHLMSSEISAWFINNEGTAENMLDGNEKYLYADKIARISEAINEDTIKLKELNNKLISK